ncbi:hypothetical protein BDV96DRAFT_642177 [Lophiotrema nucula]|uniref:Uncharacterized protein n=1 Tax=Lophiotrema nucula TaxID=690887 RepID=A0A6A5ZM46_9PLEO|nr:hypothetical protein BDV96DRAFT_642177 [Lophiotrema nucula]
MISNEQSQLLKLAQEVQQLTFSLVSYLSETGVAEPDFTTSSSEISYSAAYTSIRAKPNEVAQDLLLLVNGPRIEACRFVCSHNDLGAYQFAFKFGLIYKGPQEGKISLLDLSEQTRIDEICLGRMLRLLCSRRLFIEPEPDHFAHTSMTIIYAQD